jgi:phosphoribosylamine--glycine ligase
MEDRAVPRVAKVFVAPGNGGTAREPELTNIPGATIADLAEFAAKEPSPSRSSVRKLRSPPDRRHVPRRGPQDFRRHQGRSAARELEGLREELHGAARHSHRAATDVRPMLPLRAITCRARGADRRQGGWPGGGKGVVVAQTVAEAHAAIDAMLVGHSMGAAGARVVIEEFLAGEEASFIVMADGRHVLPLASSQDHKRLRDHDQGPNTGGMGAYSPAPVITPAIHARIMREVILPTSERHGRRWHSDSGFLYAGVMIDAAGTPKVLEFNCRLGDPETQPIMVRLKSDLLDLIEHGVNGTLDRVEAEWDRRAALGVVLAARGYPHNPDLGEVIDGLDRLTRDTHPDCKVFHAGTAQDRGRTVVSEGACCASRPWAIR